ncbi:hypothetical protein KOI35_00105 [Actinoplanes bogorensis]|uniref:ABC transporter permease n=1 Tax=Paractinoplanes bogorensis TaxID=1610840 RepID=A0ABS5YF27_9ACTN|nr:hypothetical protein [Actinoplanes bogorensis]MBU2661898.1 hypothetical protein [Actinoplanes bogorensis]
MSSEARYRRLLTLYPRDFRREYGDEMLGVLMSDPRPGVPQALDLVRGAVLAHLRLAFTGQSRAARVVQIVGATLLFALALHRVSGVLSTRAVVDDPSWVTIDTTSWVRLAAWGVALAGAWLGSRWLGAAGAAVGLGNEIAVPFQSYLVTPASVRYADWFIVTAMVVLAAGLVAERGALRMRGWSPATAEGLTVRAWPLVVAAGALMVVHGMAFAYQLGSMRNGFVLVAGLFVLVFAVRQPRELRGRLAAWAAPVLITVPLMQWGFGDFIEFTVRNPDTIRPIGPLQWAAMVLIPAAAFLGVARLNNRIERDRSVNR